jgi:PAS domain S-box-containing protein
MSEKRYQELLKELKQLKEKNSALRSLCDQKSAEIEALSERAHSFEWMFIKKQIPATEYETDYGDLSLLNKNGLIKKHIEKEQLHDIVAEYLDVLETSSAIYEKNGDYAMGIFSSGWCQMMDSASRRLCNTDDNSEALAGGKWLCHESCWSDASSRSMREGKPVEVACNGGINLYAVPVYANGQVIGAINFGFGSPPKDDAELKRLSKRYKLPLKELQEHSAAYNDRPRFIIDYAKRRIHSSAKYLGYLVERKEAELKLAESEARYRNILETAPVGIAIHQNDIIVFVNPEGLRMLGADSDEQLIGKEITSIIHPDNHSELKKRIKRLKSGEQGLYPTEDKYVRLDGEVIDVEVMATFLTYKNKPAVQVIVTDITERKKMLKELIAAKEKAEESDRLKSAFLANMSHEIRTPMNGILGFTQLLSEPDLKSEEIENYIEIVHQSGQRMLNTVSDIIEISKIEAGLVKATIKEADLNASLEGLIRFFKPEAEKKGLKLIVDKLLADTTKTILTDQNKLDSILTNLIKNAIKYTESGTIQVGYRKKGRFIEFYIRDTGIGIPKQRQQAIFDRFIQADITYARAVEGSGLGLAIAKSHVEMLRGEMWVESEEGVGSTFCFTLPYEVREPGDRLRSREKV